MKVLYTSTLAISATNDTPTSGQVLPLFLKLEQHFITLETDSEFVKLIKKAVWGNLQTRYQEEDAKKFLEEATALDPRFKHKMATNIEVWERITHRAAELHKKQYPPVVVPVKAEPGVESDSDSVAESAIKEEPTEEQPKKKLCALEELFGEEDDVVITGQYIPTTPETQAHLPGIVSRDDPLLFYYTHRTKIPLLRALVPRYFCLPGSSVPSERIFSLAGQTISQERARMDPDKADMLIFLKQNASPIPY